MIARACRYFGESRDYWWDNLTVRVVIAHNKELGIRPPVEEFVGLYFRMHDWWTPPDVDGEQADNPVEEMPDVPDEFVDFSL